MNPIIALVAIVAAADVPQRVSQLRDHPPTHRLAIGAAVVAAATGAAALATPLLDALDVSSPTMEVAGGMVLILWSLVAFFRWASEPAEPGVAIGLVPGFFPVVLTPALGVVLVAVGSRNGYPVTVAGGLIAAAVLAAATRSASMVGRRSARMASATAGVVVGIVMMTDGVLAV